MMSSARGCGAATWLVACGLLLPVRGAAHQQAASSAPVNVRATAPLAQVPIAPLPASLPSGDLSTDPKLQALHQRATQLLQDGSLDMAQAVIDEALRLAKTPVYELEYLKALLSLKTQNFAAAAPHANLAARLAPESANAHWLVGTLARQSGNLEEAIAHLRRATLNATDELNNPLLTLAWSELGDCLASAGYLTAAQEAYEQFDEAIWTISPEQRNVPEIAELLKGRPHGALELRLALLEQLDKPQQLLRLARKGKQRWSDDEAVSRLYAQALLDGGEAREAREYCVSRLSSGATAAAYFRIAAQAAHQTGEAMPLAEWALEHFKDLAPRELIAEFVRLQELASADRIAAALAQRFPESGPAAWELIAVRLAQERWSEALTAMRHLAQREPGGATLLQQRINQLSQTPSGTPALKALLLVAPEKAADFAEDFVRGLLTEALPDPAAAKALYQSSLEKNAAFVPAQAALGELWLRQFDWNAARDYASTRLEQSPDSAALHTLLAQALDGLDENEECQRQFKNAIRLAPDDPRPALLLGRHYLRLADNLAAQRYLQQAFRADPRDSEAFESLIESYIRDGKTEIARAVVKQVDPATLSDDVARRVDTIMRFVGSIFSPRHIAELQRQFQAHPDDSRTAALLAAGLLFAGQPEQAGQIADQIASHGAPDQNTLLLRAQALTQQADFERAIQVLEQLRERFPNRADVLEFLARLDLADFRVDQSRAIYERLIERENAKRPSYRVQLLRTYVAFGQHDQALGLVEKWLRDEPGNGALAAQRLTLLAASERGEEALAEISKQLAANPDDPGRREEFVALALAAKQYSRLIEQVRQWLQRDSGNEAWAAVLVNALILDDRAAEALEFARSFEPSWAGEKQRRLWLGQAHAALGETEKALTEFQAILAFEGQVDLSVRVQARNEVISTLTDAGQFDRALEQCNQWESSGAINPDEIKFYRQLIYQTAGMDAQAVPLLEERYHMAPDDAGANNDLGYTLLELGVELPRATRMIRKAIAVDPLNAAFLDSFGWAFYKAGDWTSARKYLERAVKLPDGADGVVFDHLGDACWRAGEKQAAAEAWTRSIQEFDREKRALERARHAAARQRVAEKLAALHAGAQPGVAGAAAEAQSEK